MQDLFPSFIQQLAQASPHFYGGAPAGGNMFGFVLIGLMALISYAVQHQMMAKMKRYSEEPAPFSGAEVAKMMMEQNGIQGVTITSTPGQLTDHYNPADRSINLSEMVYQQRTVAAMAVAAHETGHALQHAQGYAWLQLRSSLVPMVNIGSKLGTIILMVGLVLMAMGSGTTVAWIGVLLFATTTLFAFVTLPVEFDASRRALAWLESSGLVAAQMQGEAKTALHWAAMTYVTAALSSLAMLLYYVMMLVGRSNDD